MLDARWRCCPRTSRAPSAPRCWPRWRKRGCCRRASARPRRVAREALAVARAVGDRDVEAARSTRSAWRWAARATSTPASRRCARRSRSRARPASRAREGRVHQPGRRAPHQRPHARGARGGARGPRDARPRHRAHDWLRLNVAEFTYYLGHWDEARGCSRRRAGATPAPRCPTGAVRAACSRSAAAISSAARADLDGLERPARGSTEPQFVGAYGWMRAELERRRGDIDAGARRRRRGARPDRVLLGRLRPHRRRVRRRGARRGRRRQLARDRRDAEARAGRAAPRRGADRARCG